MFLLRRYSTSPRDEIGDALARALTWTVVNQPWTEARDDDRAAWLTLLAEAAAVSDDDRVREAVVDLAPAVRHQAGAASSLADAARSTEACLHATEVFDLADLLQPTIDRLEQIVGGAYEPGEGMGRGGLADQVYPASALLAAYSITGRLPYSMLAEELMQFARRTLWDEGDGGFFSRVGELAKPFASNCDAARVLCRLASLHLDGDYHRAAVTARDADYARDAERTLASQAASLDACGSNAALYGLALSEWLDLQQHCGLRIADGGLDGHDNLK